MNSSSDNNNNNVSKTTLANIQAFLDHNRNVLMKNKDLIKDRESLLLKDSPANRLKKKYENIKGRGKSGDGGGGGGGGGAVVVKEVRGSGKSGDGGGGGGGALVVKEEKRKGRGAIKDFRLDDGLSTDHDDKEANIVGGPAPSSSSSSASSYEADAAAAAAAAAEKSAASSVMACISSETYTYEDTNLSASKGNEITRQILCYLDCVRYGQYRGAFIDAALDEANLGDICNDGDGDGSLLRSFLSDNIGVKDKENHREMLFNILTSLL